jgi:dethiobiotin synthetase
MKPVAAGCEATPDGLRNDDVEILRQAASFEVDRALMNPYLFRPAISPHLAAAQAGVVIDIELLRARLQDLRSMADVVLVEGAGGWLSPVSEDATMADLAWAFGVPVLLVVGLRLGCLNHALLTAQSIAHLGVPFAGWIGNAIDPAMPQRAENLATLVRRLSCPLLGVVPHLDRAESGVALDRCFDLGPLLED